MTEYSAMVVLKGRPGKYTAIVVEGTDPATSFVRTVWKLHEGDSLRLGLNRDLAEDTGKVEFEDVEIAEPGVGKKTKLGGWWGGQKNKVTIKNKKGKDVYTLTGPDASVCVITDTEDERGRGDESYKFGGRLKVWQKDGKLIHKLVPFDPVMVNQGGGGR